MSRPDRIPDERMAAYVDDCLGERERDRFVAELRVNPQLRQDLEEYQRTVEYVRRALQAPTAPVDLADRVMAKVAAQAEPLRVVGSNRSYRLVLSMAAAAALLALAVWLNSLPTGSAGDVPTTDSVAQNNTSQSAPQNTAEQPNAAAKKAQYDLAGKVDETRAGAFAAANPEASTAAPGGDPAVQTLVVNRQAEAGNEQSDARFEADRAREQAKAGAASEGGLPAIGERSQAAVESESVGLAQIESPRARKLAVPPAGAASSFDQPLKSDDFYLGSARSESAESKAGSKDKKAGVTAIPDLTGELQLQSAASNDPAVGPDILVLNTDSKPVVGAPMREALQLAGADPTPLAYLRLTRFVAPELVEKLAERGIDPPPAGGRPEAVRRRAVSEPAAPAPSGPTTPAPATPAPTTGGTADQGPAGAGRVPGRGSYRGDELAAFVTEQFAAPAPIMAFAMTTAPAVRTIGGLRFEDVTTRLTGNLEQSLERAGDDKTPTAVERCWLVEGSPAEIKAMMNQLGSLATAAGYVPSNGEVPVAPAATPARPAERAREPADEDAPEAKSAPEANKSVPDSMRVVLRFETEVRGK